MKIAPRFVVALGCLVMLALLLDWALRPAQIGAPSPQEHRVALTADPHAIGAVSPSPAAPPSTYDTSAGSADEAVEFARFNDWSARYLAAGREERVGLLAEGRSLATARRSVLARMIPADPRRALENAVPMVVRRQLPAEVVSLLEERVSAKGFFGVLGAYGAPEADQPVRREVRLAAGSKYHAFIFGRRARQQTTESISVSGIAVDRALALDERPLRVLENGEVPDSARPVVETCPVSGKSTVVARTDGALPPISEQTPAVEIEGTIHYLCDGGHIHAIEEQLVAGEGSSGGAAKPTTAITSTQSTGVRSLLYMRVAFPESNRDPQTETAAYDMMRQVNDWFVENSFGNLYLVTTVTPLIILPRTEAWYTTGVGADEFDVRADAQAVARQMGYDTSSYDLDILVYTGGPGAFGGLGYVGGKGVWLKSITVGVACHELGHNFGLWHANYWDTAGASVIGAGANSEYGNSYDTMGSASAGDLHFNANHKAQINWLPAQSFVHNVTTSGMYRIFAFDQPRLDPANRYALKITKDSDREYWAEFRQKSLSSNKWTKDGILLNWSPWVNSNGGAQLLDATPGSPDGKTDAAVVIGRTYSDVESGIHITPIGKGGTVPESMDVVVNLGAFPANRPPSATVNASATTVTANVAVSFTAAAADPDGDTLSYAWDFGDKTFSTTNSPAVSKSWSSAGDYTVRCVVSDMKGGTASRVVVVRVGSPGTFRVSGVITQSGLPLANVRVHNGLTGTSYRGSFTNSDGSYVISGVAAGSYTFGAALDGMTFTATGFTNPLTVSADFAAANFTATAAAKVTLVVTDVDCTEGADTGRFTLTRTGSTAAALAVNFYNPTGSATKGTDYTLAPDLVAVSPVYTATIPAGQSTLDLLVTASDDTAQEGPETVRLEMLPGTGYVIAGSEIATLVIQDNDTTKPVVSLAVTDANASETGDPAAFVVTRTGSTASALTVVFAVSGTATSGSDYQSLGTSVVIPAGALSAPLNITPINDAAVEGTETVTVTLSTNANYIRAPSSADYAGTINLLDDDVATLTVVAADPNAAEAGSDPGVFVITRTGSTSQALTVNYALTGSALQGVDYLPLAGVLTIPAGASTGSVVITPIDDGLGEPAQTVVLQIRGGIGYVAGPSALATVNITDNGDVPVVTVGVSDGVAGEPSDVGKFTFTTTGTGTGNITIHYTVSGTATPGSDYTALPGTLSIARNGTAAITVTPLDDALLEDAETVTVTIDPDPAYTTHLDTSATINLLDNDQPIVHVSPTNDAFSEASGTGKFWISRTGATTAALTVNYTLAGTATNGADYNLLSGVATIPAAASGVSVDIIPINDTTTEGTESIVLTLAPGTYGIGISNATLYMADTETPAVQVRFASSTGTGAESAGTVNVSVTLSAASANPVTVEYIGGGGSALAGIDYQLTPGLLTPGLLTFAPGEVAKTIPLTILDDTFIEPSQTVILKLQNANGAALGTSTFTYTITDNDAAPSATVGFATTTSSALESVGTAPVAVVLSAPQAGAVTVNYAVTGGTATSGADYTLAGGTLTFAAGETAKPLPNTIINDATIESAETVIVTLSSPTGASLSANATHTLTLTDDDTNTVTVAASTPTVREAGPGTGVFTLTRTGSNTTALTVNLVIAGTAAPGTDYQTLAATATISAGQSSATVLVTPFDDTLVQGDKTVALALDVGAYTVGASANDTVTIIDDDAFVSLAVTIPATAESSPTPGLFTLTRTGSTANPLTVRFATTGTATSGADYSAVGTSAVIPAGQSSAPVSITALADSLVEGNETATLTIAPDPAYLLGSSLVGNVTIADSPMDNWRSLKFGANANNPAIGGDAIDIEGDGLNNLLEYALNGTPSAFDAPPAVGSAPGILSLTYRRNLAATDLDFIVEEKSDLLSAWHPATVTEEIVSDNGTTRVIKAKVSTASESTHFLRLNVTRH
ncbi:MAG: PKD domain-containing protein [Chthoniobacter sp.]|nr:PKD domain-containing protein [Chthoniobacter sp.]